MRAIKIFSLIAIVILATGCATTTTRTHATLEADLKRIDTVVILPPAVSIELLTLTGENERMTEAEEAFSTQLLATSKTHLKRHGFNIIDYDFEKGLMEEPDLAYAITQIHDGFNLAKEELQFGRPIKQAQASKVNSSVGDATNILQTATGADAILLINYMGFDKSGGHVAKDIATSVLVGVLTMGSVVPVAPKSYSVTEIALLDATSGNILWADTSPGQLSSVTTPENLMRDLPHDIDDITQDNLASAADLNAHEPSQ